MLLNMTLEGNGAAVAAALESVHSASAGDKETAEGIEQEVVEALKVYFF